MSKIDDVRSAMMQAMKDKDKARKDALSLLLAALKNKAIDKRADLTEEEENAVVIEVSVAPNDTGKIIGKNGKVAQAIRSILHSAAYKQTKKYIFKIK